MTSRYCYCPMTQRRIWMRLTLKDRIARWLWLNLRKDDYLDVYPVTGFYPPVWIRHEKAPQGKGIASGERR